MNFYVYRVDHIETKEFYIGSRGCKCLPEEDIKYMGSMSSWKPDKTKLVKTILKKDFSSRDEALIHESVLIKENIKNDLNRNYHVPNIGYNSHGMVTVKDKNGKTLQVKVNDPKFLSGELVSINKNMIPVKDKDGNTCHVTKEDPRYLSGELVHVTTNKIVIKDKDGKIIMVDNNDPKYLSGEYIHIFKGKTVVKDKNGKTLQVDIDDPRFLSGELVGIHKGVPPYNKGKKCLKNKL